MFIESTASPARRMQWHGLALAAMLVAFCPLPMAATAAGTPTRLPATENEKEVFDAIRNSQFQAAVNALVRAPDGKRVAITELADEHGMTALHWAAENRNAAGVRWLLDKGAKLELKDDKGRTPLKIALDNKDVSAMTLLITWGANTSTVLPGYDDELKVLKNTSDIVGFMIAPKRCDAGDAAICHSIGLAYDNGTEGFSVNRKLAAGYYEKACARDIPAACTNLGYLYQNGEGVTKDTSRAAVLYKKACDANEPSACANLGGLHSFGEGVAKDESRATALFEKACTAGYARACSLLGDQYGDGRGAAKDEAKAAVNYTKACDGGFLRGCGQLGYYYRNGIGVARDSAKAATLYGKACGPNVPIPCLNLGRMHYDGEGMPKDHARAAALFTIACDANDAEACGRLSLLTMKGEGVPLDDARAAGLAQKACAGGYASSCTGVGYRYLFGNGVPKDEHKAVAMFEKACSEKDGAGCDGLGVLYQTGTGVAEDAAKAAALFAKGCQLGYQGSCKRQTAKAASSATPAKATAAAPAAVTPASTACKIARVQPGVDTVASVGRDIQARGGSPLTGGSGPSKYRMSAMSGDYQDAGTDVMAVNYDFDAAGPAGRLVAVTIVNHAYTGPGYEKLLATRKAAAAAIVGPLQQKSATELVASAPGCQLRLLPNADTWYIYEVYQLPN